MLEIAIKGGEVLVNVVEKRHDLSHWEMQVRHMEHGETINTAMGFRFVGGGGTFLTSSASIFFEEQISSYT